MSHTHGRTGTPEYRAWRHLINRCENVKSKDYSEYGGRGIVVCRQWRASFLAFLADVGLRPTSDHSIDRFPNQDGNYEPGNVRWATKAEQSRNRRNNQWVTVGGRTLLVADWAIASGLKPSTISLRLKAGWPPEQAVTAPSGTRIFSRWQPRKAYQKTALRRGATP